MRKWLFIFAMGLAACSSQLRSPVCRQTLEEFPESVRGHYMMVLPANSILNSSFALKEEQFELRKDGVYFSKAQSIPAPFMGLDTKNLCLIDGEIYFQRLNDNSTYSLAKLEPTSYGLMVNDISFDINEVRSRGVPVFYLPEIKWDNGYGGEGGRWSQDTLITGLTPYIFDNRTLSPEATVRLGHLTSVRIMFERAHPTVQKKFRVLLSDLKRANDQRK